MSTNDDSEIVQFAKNPMAWFLGAIGSIAAVLAALAFDPTGAVATVVLALIDQAGIIFTAATITGFTLAPEIEWIPQGKVQFVAIVFGIIVVITVLDRVWDNLKERLDDD